MGILVLTSCFRSSVLQRKRDLCRRRHNSVRRRALLAVTHAYFWTRKPRHELETLVEDSGTS